MSFFLRRIAATAVLAALALPVLAQPAPPAPPVADGQATSGQKPNNMQKRHQTHMATRINDLKAQLKLTPAQEPAWAAFTAALQPAERPAHLDTKNLEKLTTPERIDRMRALRAQHAAEADRRGEATKTFYAALTPEQQKTFDAQEHHMHRMGEHHGGWGYSRGERHDHHNQDMRGGDMPMGARTR